MTEDWNYLSNDFNSMILVKKGPSNWPERKMFREKNGKIITKKIKYSSLWLFPRTWRHLLQFIALLLYSDSTGQKN